MFSKEAMPLFEWLFDVFFARKAIVAFVPTFW